MTRTCSVLSAALYLHAASSQKEPGESAISFSPESACVVIHAWKAAAKMMIPVADAQQAYVALWPAPTDVLYDEATNTDMNATTRRA